MAKKVRKTYGVLVSYSYNKHGLDLDKVADRIAKEGRDIGSGCGFGERDLTYEYRSRVGAMRAILRFGKDRRFKIFTKEPEQYEN